MAISNYQSGKRWRSTPDGFIEGARRALQTSDSHVQRVWQPRAFGWSFRLQFPTGLQAENGEFTEVQTDVGDGVSRGMPRNPSEDEGRIYYDSYTETGHSQVIICDKTTGDCTPLETEADDVTDHWNPQPAGNGLIRAHRETSGRIRQVCSLG